MNWEYSEEEQRLGVSFPGVAFDSAYKENGEWRVADSTGCRGVLHSELEGALGFLKVSSFEPGWFVSHRR